MNLKFTVSCDKTKSRATCSETNNFLTFLESSCPRFLKLEINLAIEKSGKQGYRSFALSITIWSSLVQFSCSLDIGIALDVACLLLH